MDVYIFLNVRIDTTTYDLCQKSTIKSTYIQPTNRLTTINLNHIINELRSF